MNKEELYNKHHCSILNNTYSHNDSVIDIAEASTKISIEYAIGVLEDLRKQTYPLIGQAHIMIDNKISELKQLLK